MENKLKDFLSDEDLTALEQRVYESVKITERNIYDNQCTPLVIGQVATEVLRFLNGRWLERKKSDQIQQAVERYIESMPQMPPEFRVD